MLTPDLRASGLLRVHLSCFAARWREAPDDIPGTNPIPCQPIAFPQRSVIGVKKKGQSLPFVSRFLAPASLATGPSPSGPWQPPQLPEQTWRPRFINATMAAKHSSAAPGGAEEDEAEHALLVGRIAPRVDRAVLDEHVAATQPHHGAIGLL